MDRRPTESVPAAWLDRWQQPQIRRPILAAFSWIAFGIMVAWVVYVDWRQLRHPSHWVTIGPLVAQLIALLALVAELFPSTTGSAVSYPRRWGLLGLSTTPMLWLGLLVGSASISAEQTSEKPIYRRGRQSVRRLVSETLVRLTRPYRITGSRVILCTGSQLSAAELVAEADQFLFELASRFGKATAPVYWVRRPLLADFGRNLAAFAVVGDADRGVIEESRRWGSEDRHQLALAHLDQFLQPAAAPPRFLREGFARWASINDIQSDESIEALLTSAWSARQSGRFESFSELMTESLVDVAGDDVRDYGAAVVHYLIQTHNQSKFIEFYRTCRAETIDMDCQRSLQLNLREIDQGFGDFLIRELNNPTPISQLLAAIQIQRSADQDTWRRFTAAHQQYLQHFWKRSHEIELEIRDSRDQTSTTASAVSAVDSSIPPVHIRFWLDGSRSAVQVRRDAEVLTWVATPANSFFARQQLPSEPPVMLRGGQDRSAYNNVRGEMQFYVAAIDRLLSPWLVDFPSGGSRFGRWQLESIETVNASSTIEASAADLVRLALTRPNVRPGYPRRATIEGSPVDGRITLSWIGTENAMGVPFSARRTVGFDDLDPPNIRPREVWEESLDEQGAATSSAQLKVVEWRSGDGLPAESFTAQHFGLPPISFPPASTGHDWRLLFVTLAFLWPAIGLGLFLAA